MQERQAAEAPRLGDWMITFTGRRFWPLDPRPEDVSFRDVARALSQICRYGGHSRHYYSVAEHSRLMAEYLERQGAVEAARFALLHDAPEAYVGDMVRPLKRSGLHTYKDVEVAIERAVFAAAGLAGDIPAAVHEVDTAILLNEALALFGEDVVRRTGWTLPRAGLRGVRIETDDPLDAEWKFSTAFKRLFPDVEFA